MGGTEPSSFQTDPVGHLPKSHPLPHPVVFSQDPSETPRSGKEEARIGWWAGKWVPGVTKPRVLVITVVTRTYEGTC